MKYEVQDIMTKDVLWVKPEEDLNHVFNLMKDFDFRHVPVLEDGELSGLVSKGDILLIASKNDFSVVVPDMKVREMMTVNLITCTPETPLHEASSMMHAARIKCLPVIQGQYLVGMITTSDVLEFESTSSSKEKIRVYAS